MTEFRPDNRQSKNILVMNFQEIVTTTMGVVCINKKRSSQFFRYNHVFKIARFKNK